MSEQSIAESDFGMLERRCAQLETFGELMTWLQAGKYRHLIHRHDGAIRAVDEALNVSWESDNWSELYALIKANPVTERAP
jgi:hypothetical protein